MKQAETGGLTGQTLGGYQLRGLLGAGGMAEIYRALDTALEREVAVKVLPASLAVDPGYVARFRDEAKHVAALNHPHIVPIYGYGEERGLLFLVMPIMPESLRDRLEHMRTLPPEDAVRLALQIASALEAAHALGFVHRDVKPENVLLDAAGAAHLTDFGIAREVAVLRQQGVARTLASTGLPVGTPEYMSPEQLRGESIDQRVDVYALGAVLYEMLTGRVPHEAETPYHVAMLAATEPVVAPSKRNPTIWPALDQVALKALARDPNDRYPTMGSFAAALEEAMTAEAMAEDPTVALPPLPVVPVLPPYASGAVTTADPPKWQPASSEAQPQTTRPRRALWIGLSVLALILLIAGAGSALVLSQGGTPSPTTGLSSAAVTATTPPTATTQPTATATRQPTATTAPVPPLAIGPTPLVLAPNRQNPKICVAMQTITNTSGHMLGWKWQPPAQGGFHFIVNGNAPVGWPSDMSPGIAPGSHDTLVVMTDCKSQPQSFSVQVQDSLGYQYTFAMQVQAQLDNQN